MENIIFSADEAAVLRDLAARTLFLRGQKLSGPRRVTSISVDPAVWQIFRAATRRANIKPSTVIESAIRDWLVNN